MVKTIYSHSRKKIAILESAYDLEPQRVCAAFLAMALRLAGESASALAFPPLVPPSFPSATAAGFFPAFGSSSGVPSKCSPIVCSTTRRATVVKS
jgi:hypothetical protein